MAAPGEEDEDFLDPGFLPVQNPKSHRASGAAKKGNRGKKVDLDPDATIGKDRKGFVRLSDRVYSEESLKNTKLYRCIIENCNAMSANRTAMLSHA